MSTGRTKKIYYVPGMISLLIIPVLLFYFTSSKTLSSVNYGISICWADENRFKEKPELFGQLPPKRNYIDISLTGNKLENSINLNFAQLKIRSILSDKDSLTGIHFLFNESAEYRAFVKAIDICRIENAKSYIPYKNHLWFFYSPMRPVDTSNQIELIEL